jgi:hypothetical protein
MGDFGLFLSVTCRALAMSRRFLIHLARQEAMYFALLARLVGSLKNEGF